MKKQTARVRLFAFEDQGDFEKHFIVLFHQENDEAVPQIRLATEAQLAAFEADPAAQDLPGVVLCNWRYEVGGLVAALNQMKKIMPG